MSYKWNGQEYATAQDLARAKRFKALDDVVHNRGLRSHLWNFFARPADKERAKKNYESMMKGGSGISYY